MSTRGYSQNLTLVNNPKKPLKDILKEDYQKALKNNFINPTPGTSDQLLFTLQIEFKKILLLVTYYLTKFEDIL